MLLAHIIFHASSYVSYSHRLIKMALLWTETTWNRVQRPICPRPSLSSMHQLYGNACLSPSILHLVIHPRLYVGNFPFPEDPFTSFLTDGLLAIKQVLATTVSGKTSLTVAIWVDFYECTVWSADHTGCNCLFATSHVRAETAFSLPPYPRSP